MKLGIFSKVFERGSIEAILDAVAANGLASIQLNLESLAGEPMPAQIDPSLCAGVRSALDERGLELAAVSGTWNIIHATQGPAGLSRLRTLARACSTLGTELITMCTGTCDPDYLWRAHADNDTPAAWQAMVRAMAACAAIAEDAGVRLVFEPEVNNVVNTALKARALLDELASQHVQVVIDGANLFHAGQLGRMHDVLDEAFQLLGNDIRLAHAKDLEKDGDAGHQAAGTGVLDYEHYLACLHHIGFSGSVILHSLDETQVPASRAHVLASMPNNGR